MSSSRTKHEQWKKEWRARIAAAKARGRAAAKQRHNQESIWIGEEPPALMPDGRPKLKIDLGEGNDGR